MTEHIVVPFPGTYTPEPEVAEPEASTAPLPETWAESDLPQFLYYVQGLTDAEDDEAVRRWMGLIRQAVIAWPT